MPIPRDCRDGLLRASWQRPEAYLDPDVRGSISALDLGYRLVIAGQGVRPQ